MPPSLLIDGSAQAPINRDEANTGSVGDGQRELKRRRLALRWCDDEEDKQGVALDTPHTTQYEPLVDAIAEYSAPVVDKTKLVLFPVVPGKQKIAAVKKRKPPTKVKLQWPKLNDFMFWVHYHPDILDVRLALTAYPRIAVRGQKPSVKSVVVKSSDHMHRGVIPAAKVDETIGAFAGKSAAMNMCDQSDDDSAQALVALYDRFAANGTLFPQSYIAAAGTYYEARKALTVWVKAKEWLQDKDLQASQSVDPASPAQAVDGWSRPPVEVKANLLTQLKASALNDKFVVEATTVKRTTQDIIKATTVALTVQDVIGNFADTGKLTGKLLHAALESLCVRVGKPRRSDVVVLDPGRESQEILPAQRPTEVNYIVIPFNQGASHWIVTVVELQWHDGRICCWLYDPLTNADSRPELEGVFETRARPLLEAWTQRDGILMLVFQSFEWVWVTAPQQQPLDHVNCGYYCILVTSQIISRKQEQARHTSSARPSVDQNLDANDLAVLRVRVLHLLLCDSTKEKATHDDKMKIHHLDKVFQELLR